MKAISSFLSSNKKRKSMAATKDRSKILDTTPVTSAPPSPPLSPLFYPHRKQPVSTSNSASTTTSFTTAASLDYGSKYTYDYNDRPQVPGFFESPRAPPPVPSTSSSSSSFVPPPLVSPPRSPSRMSLKNASIPWGSKPIAGHVGIEGLALVTSAAGDLPTVSYSSSLQKALPEPGSLPSPRSSMARRAMIAMRAPRDDSLRAPSKHANKPTKTSLPPHHELKSSIMDPATHPEAWDPFAARSPLSPPSSSPIIAPPAVPALPPSPSSSGRLGKSIHRLLQSRSTHGLRERAHRSGSTINRPSSRGNGSRPPSRGNGYRPREGSLPTPKSSSSSFARRRAQSVGAPAPVASFDLPRSGLPPPPIRKVGPTVNVSTSVKFSTPGNLTRNQGLDILLSSPSPSTSPTPSAARKALRQHPPPSPSRSQFQSSFPSLLSIDLGTDSDADSRDRSNSMGTVSTSASSSPRMPNQRPARRASGARRNPSVSSKRSMPELDGVWKSFVRDCAEDIDLDLSLLGSGPEAVVENSHPTADGEEGGPGQGSHKAEMRRSRHRSIMNGSVQPPTRALPLVPLPHPKAQPLAIKTMRSSPLPSALAPSAPLPTPPFTPIDGTTQMLPTLLSEAYDLESVHFCESEDEKRGPAKSSLRPTSTCTTSSSHTLTLSNISCDPNHGDLSTTPTLSSGSFPIPAVFPGDFRRVPVSCHLEPLETTVNDSQAFDIPASSVRLPVLKNLDALRHGSTLLLSSFPKPPSRAITPAPAVGPRSLPSGLPLKARHTLPITRPSSTISGDSSFPRSVGGSTSSAGDIIARAPEVDEWPWTESSLGGDHGHESSATSSLYDTAESSFSCGSDVASDGPSSPSSRWTTLSDGPPDQNYTISHPLATLRESQPQSSLPQLVQQLHKSASHRQKPHLQQLSSKGRDRSISPPFARMQAELQLVDFELPRVPRLRHSSPASSPVLSSAPFQHTPSITSTKNPLHHTRGYSFDEGYAM